jgi:putative transposase
MDLDGDLVSQGTQLLAQLAIELEAEQQIGASRYERSPGRTTYRNGHRERVWETRVGETPLRIPKLREGQYFPSMLEPRRRAEKALLGMAQAAYVQGVSTWKVDDLLQALGRTGIDKSKVSRIYRELDELVEAFRNRPLHGSCPYLWLDALYLKVRQDHRIVSQTLVVAIGAKETGEREILGFSPGQSEEYAFWLDFLRGLVRRGFKGVELVISDAHEGLKAAIEEVLAGSTWQRYHVIWVTAHGDLRCDAGHSRFPWGFPDSSGEPTSFSSPW